MDSLGLGHRRFAFYLGVNECCVDGRRQKMGPFAIVQRSRQVIEDELYGHGVRQWTVPKGPTVAKLQPGQPVGEGAAVAAHRIGGCPCSNECLRGCFIRPNINAPVKVSFFRSP